jgi:hypothetical protein
MATPDLAGLLQAWFAGDRGLLAMAKASRPAARVTTPELAGPRPEWRPWPEE